MKVYHGSPSKFDTFRYENIGRNGTAEGFGFYFTNKKRVAKLYANNGFIYTATLRGKELSGSQKTIDRDEYIKLVTYLDKEVDYLSNYGEIGYEGFQVVLDRAIKEEWEQAGDDAELLGGIINACGDVELVCRSVYQLLGYGYIVDDSPDWGNADSPQTVHVALTNEIIDVVNIENVE